MRLAYFPGCKITFDLPEYGKATVALVRHLGVELVTLPFVCCGYPAREKNFAASVLSAIQNLALAQSQGLEILVPCKCCFGQFRHAVHWYRSHEPLREKIDRILRSDGLFFYDDRNGIHHLIPFLHDRIGLDRLKTEIVRPFPARPLAIQHGCHALRPFTVTGFDHPFSPSMFETLVAITGLAPKEWSESRSCCGNPIRESNADLSLKILDRKLAVAAGEGADHICTACTHCQIQYTRAAGLLERHGLTAWLLPQLLGTAMGISPKKLFSAKKPPAEI